MCDQNINLAPIHLDSLLAQLREQIIVPAEILLALPHTKNTEPFDLNQVKFQKNADFPHLLPLLLDFLLIEFFLVDVGVEDMLMVARNDHLLDSGDLMQNLPEELELFGFAVLSEVSGMDEDVSVGEGLDVVKGDKVVSVGDGQKSDFLVH